MKITAFEQLQSRSASEEELATLLASDKTLVWVDMVGPTDDDVRAMEHNFGFHPLAIEDTLNQSQRPKVEEYEDHLFIILNPGERTNHASYFRELDVFIGGNYFVTVHREPEPFIDEAVRRLSFNLNVSHTPGHLLYVLMDAIVDGYFQIIDTINEDIDSLEDAVLQEPDGGNMAQLLALRRSILAMSRIVSAQRDMFNALIRPDLSFLAYAVLQYHMRDVHDHIIRVTESLNIYREVVTTLVELHTSAISNRLNQVVNRLTIVTIMVGSLGVISGFYGMNFEHTWPPFSAKWGVDFALAVMVVLIVIILATLKRLRWF